ncbi:MAG: RNA polymerase sigma factor RpoH [Magnetococcus sp. WYHC-3]
MSHALVPVLRDGELSRYVAEIERFPMLTAREEYDCAVRYRDTADLDAAHRLVTAHLRYVVKIAREYQGYGLRMADLVQEGSLGLMRAVKKFDPDRGFRLSTYALWWIRAAIQEFILRSWSLVKVGTTAAQRKLFFNLRQSKQSIGHMDRDEAIRIGTALGVDTETVLEMDGRMSSRDDSLNRSLVEDGEELQNLIADGRENQEQRLLARESEVIRRQSVQGALANLDPREREIVLARVMSERPATLEDLGVRLGVSRERVRQLEKRALDKLRTALAGMVGEQGLCPA